MYVRLCMCMYIRAYVCMHVCVYVCMCVDGWMDNLLITANRLIKNNAYINALRYVAILIGCANRFISALNEQEEH